ncbi:unnamed protein product [Meloidogyne enterolobii]|uniref:Uncharacterized protein n=1 Tax=Meloidogyne enterolobii TaxID=390850 RepID=A0ACB1A5P1_MELEN
MSRVEKKVGSYFQSLRVNKKYGYRARVTCDIPVIGLLYQVTPGGLGPIIYGSYRGGSVGTKIHAVEVDGKTTKSCAQAVEITWPCPDEAAAAAIF